MNSDSAYCIAYEKSLSSLERKLYHLQKPDDIIIGVLIAVCSFYEADWVGVLDVDIDVGIWKPIWWNSADKGAMHETRLRAFEVSEVFGRWEQALKHGESIALRDVECIKKDSPDEYCEYKRLGIYSLLGAPYHKRRMGFLVVKNPRTFSERMSYLQTMTYVIATEAGERDLVDGAKMIVPPQMVKHQNEVYICLFGGLEIYTYQGRLDEQHIRSPKICRIIVYLLCHKKRAVSARELAEQLWPNDVEGMNVNIRSLIYRFRKIFRLICNEDLIETVNGKYHINPLLTIVTDKDILDQLYLESLQTADTRRRIHLLKKAAYVYRGSLYPDANSEHWLMPVAAEYQLRFLHIEEELLELLSEKGGYHTIFEETKRALSLEHGNMILYYWMILSLVKQGTTESAKQALQMAKQNLTSDDFSELIVKLKTV